MFGSKPWPKDPSGTHPDQTACEGPWAFQPWLVQLKSYGPAPDPADPWGKGIVRLQYLSGEVSKEGELLKEKNWNPFIYKGQLFFSQVGRVDKNVQPGACEQDSCVLTANARGVGVK
jgi:hypothetical protein